MSLVEKEAEALITMLRMLQVNLLACETVDRGEEAADQANLLFWITMAQRNNNLLVKMIKDDVVEYWKANNDMIISVDKCVFQIKRS